MNNQNVLISKEEALSIQVFINSVTPFFEIDDDKEKVWFLWLDFLLEVQSKLMINNENSEDESFAFRCAENFQALRKTLTMLAHHKVNTQQIVQLTEVLATP